MDRRKREEHADHKTSIITYDYQVKPGRWTNKINYLKLTDDPARFDAENKRETLFLPPKFT